MSNASRQSLALLAVIYGCFSSMKEYALSPELSPTIEYGLEVSERCINEFPETGNTLKNTKWITEKIHQIDDDLNKSKSVYTMIVLTQLAHQIVTDLSEKIRDKAKIKRIEVIEEVIYAISDQIDKKKDKFEAYEGSDRIAKKLYNRLGFSL